MELQIISTAPRTIRFLTDSIDRQIPYATAQALNDVAFSAQRKIKLEMTRVFELRNKFSQGGIQINKATKADWPNIKAEIGVEEKRTYLIDHILGGKRQGGSHGRAILDAKELRNGRGRVPANNRPRALLNRKGSNSTFLITSRKWGGELLAKRVGEGPRDIRILYAFRKDVTIKREFEMDTIAARSIQADYNRAFERRLTQALATAKPKD